MCFHSQESDGFFYIRKDHRQSEYSLTSLTEWCKKFCNDLMLKFQMSHLSMRIKQIWELVDIPNGRLYSTIGIENGSLFSVLADLNISWHRSERSKVISFISSIVCIVVMYWTVFRSTQATQMMIVFAFPRSFLTTGIFFTEVSFLFSSRLSHSYEEIELTSTTTFIRFSKRILFSSFSFRKHRMASFSMNFPERSWRNHALLSVSCSLLDLTSFSEITVYCRQYWGISSSEVLVFSFVTRVSTVDHWTR